MYSEVTFISLYASQHLQSKGSDGPPILTDEEESGSTTSSCDEVANSAQDRPGHPLDKKDDYDSSATVSEA